MLANDAEAEIVRNPNPLVLPPGTTVMVAARQMFRGADRERPKEEAGPSLAIYKGAVSP